MYICMYVCTYISKYVCRCVGLCVCVVGEVGGGGGGGGRAFPLISFAGPKVWNPPNPHAGKHRMRTSIFIGICKVRQNSRGNAVP